MRPFLLLVLVLLPFAASAPARASRIKTFMMPGKLIQGHAKYESHCDRCHRAFSKEAQSELCLDCHDKVAADVKGKRGFHGRSPRVRNHECRSCHTDHIGRKARIVDLNRATFDHRHTDFPLRGAHQALTCDRCHKRGKKFRETPSKCLSCHKKQSPHRRQLKIACDRCHNARNWHRIRFDHARTKFRLQGKHKDGSCSACHPNNRFPKIPTRCVSCHKIDDVHAGRYRDDCGKCHRPEGWKKARFDHSRTKFPLRGRHKDAECEDCHQADAPSMKIDTACRACHRKEDVHLGRYGQKCDRCHVPRGWNEAKFDHDKETHFPLHGKHKKVACALCHKGKLTGDAKKGRCIGCHRGDDAHQGKLGDDCKRCHNEQGWSEKVVFEHDLSTFPLIGLHATVPCESCHLGGSYEEAPTRCIDCHQRDDFHKGRMPSRCNQCHTPNGWRLWVFDHNRQTDFELDGAHRDLACDQCHTSRFSKQGLSSVCGSCHHKDDIHDGRFGFFCERCHTTESFRDLRMLQ